MSDKPIRLLIHPYPPPLCINTLPPPLMYFDRSLSALTSRHFCLWPSTAYLQNFPRGGRLLASLNQVDLSLNNTYFLLKTPPPSSLPHVNFKQTWEWQQPERQNMQIVVFPRFLLSQVDLSAKRRFVFMCCHYCCVCHHFSATHFCCVCHCLLCFQELVVFSRACCI